VPLLAEAFVSERTMVVVTWLARLASACLVLGAVWYVSRF
jgi:hypothetical protein